MRLVVDALGGGRVRLAVRHGNQAVEIEQQPDLSAVSALAENLNGPAVRQEQMVRGLIGLRIITDARGVHTRGVAQEGRHPWFVVGGPEFDAVGQALEYHPGILGETVHGLPVDPSALVLQFLGQIPVIQGRLGLDAGLEQLIHEPVVKIETPDVWLPLAVRHHTAP